MMPYLNFFNITGFIFLVLILSAHNGYINILPFVKGALQKNANFKEQSSNQISPKGEMKAKVDEQLYYLPLQTVFGETHTVAAARSVSTTSPPHISIEPAPTENTYSESTHVFNEEMPIKEYNAANQCVSETPVIELESRFLLPSTETIKESVVMSGHLEIASKTSPVEKTYEEISKPSVVLQGTEFYSHTVTGL